MAKLREAAAPTQPQAEALDLCADGALSVRGAVEFSGLSRSRIFELIRDGELRVVRLGRVPLIPRRALVAYLARYLERAD